MDKNEISKIPATPEELASIIKGRMRHTAVLHVRAFRSEAYGWDVKVMADPRYVVGCQLEADRIARELRGMYELRE